MYFVDPEQYISPLSSKLACGQKRLFSVKGEYLKSGVIVLTSRGQQVC